MPGICQRVLPARELLKAFPSGMPKNWASPQTVECNYPCNMPAELENRCRRYRFFWIPAQASFSL